MVAWPHPQLRMRPIRKARSPNANATDNDSHSQRAWMGGIAWYLAGDVVNYNTATAATRGWGKLSKPKNALNPLPHSRSPIIVRPRIDGDMRA